MFGIQYKLYLKSVLRLTRSLVIKDLEMARAMNERDRLLFLAQGRDVNFNDEYQWRYYLNLAGQYHELDTPMTIISLDTMEEIEFNLVNLREHRGTLREYRKRTRYYDELVARYPKQEGLIRGILNPIDIKKAIEASDYTILQWSKTEVESQETNLITQLQGYIYNFRRRWVIEDYTKVDELYASAAMVTLYSKIASKIISIRNHNRRSYKAHSYHVWNFLESHGRLARYRDYLRIDQALWLYMNIEWVFSNAGKQDTFEKLMDVILTRRSIPLSAYSSRLNTQELDDTLRATPRMLRTPLNFLENDSGELDFRTPEYVMQKELPLAERNDEFYDDDLRQLKLSLSRVSNNSTPIKTYESEMIDSKTNQVVTLEEVLMQHWLYLSTHGRYNTIINVQNPQTSELMTMSVKDAFTLWLYVYNKANGITLDTIPDIHAVRVRRIPLPTFEQLRALAEKSLISDEQIWALLEDQVDMTVEISTEGFFNTCRLIHEAMGRHRKMHSNIAHYEGRARMEALVSRCYQMVDCELSQSSNGSYLGFFEERGWLIEELPRNDLLILGEDLVNTATGLDLNDTRSLSEIQAAMLNIMSQLGTYATHYIQTINDMPSVVVDNTAVRLGDWTSSEVGRFRHHVGTGLMDFSANWIGQFKNDTTRNSVMDVISSSESNSISIDSAIKTRASIRSKRQYRMELPRIEQRIVDETIESDTIDLGNDNG